MSGQTRRTAIANKIYKGTMQWFPSWNVEKIQTDAIGMDVFRKDNVRMRIEWDNEKEGYIIRLWLGDIFLRKARCRTWINLGERADDTLKKVIKG